MAVPPPIDVKVRVSNPNRCNTSYATKHTGVTDNNDIQSKVCSYAPENHYVLLLLNEPTYSIMLENVDMRSNICVRL